MGSFKYIEKGDNRDFHIILTIAFSPDKEQHMYRNIPVCVHLVHSMESASVPRAKVMQLKKFHHANVNC